jgi:hypothetical protein
MGADQLRAKRQVVTKEPDPEIQRLRDEVDKLGRVISDVMGSEFDTIQSRQADDQRSVMQWVATCMALNLAMVHLLAERGLIDEEGVLARTREIRGRLLHQIESMGTDADVQQMFGGLSSEGFTDR